jgi:hypothetical protein
MYQHFPFHGLPKINKIRFFGLKIYYIWQPRLELAKKWIPNLLLADRAKNRKIQLKHENERKKIKLKHINLKSIDHKQIIFIEKNI